MNAGIAYAVPEYFVRSTEYLVRRSESSAVTGSVGNRTDHHTTITRTPYPSTVINHSVADIPL